MPDPAIIETFDNPNPDRNYLITHTATEFTSLCPVTGQPDFGKFTFRYVADKTCIELRSLKQYLQSFRNEGIYYEAVTNKILTDLVSVCSPRWMEVKSNWTVRGGIHTDVQVRHGDDDIVPPQA